MSLIQLINTEFMAGRSLYCIVNQRIEMHI